MIALFVPALALFSSTKVTAEAPRILLIVHVRKSREKNPKECFVECDCAAPVLGSIESGSFDVAETASIADGDAASPL